MQFGEANTLTSLDGLGALRQSPEVLGVHDQPPSLTGSNAASSRNLANALAHWLFTVPTGPPRTECRIARRATRPGSARMRYSWSGSGGRPIRALNSP